VLVLLNGQGADEYISGYGLFETLLLKKYLKQINGFQFLKSFKAKHGNDYAALIKYFIPYKLIRTLLGKNRINKNIANLLSNNITYNQYNHPYDELEYYHNSVSAVTHFQLLHDPLPRYLHWEDRNSMAHSVEARVPFLDYRLVEFTRSLPLSFLVNIGQPKNILVKALQGVLPDKISTRKDKMGYTTPEEHWFINEYPDDFIELFNKFSEGLDFIFNNKKVMTFLKDVQSGNIAFSHDYWRLIHVAIWMKIFKIEAIR
jgi:asparagine synthase (glutamine-hydrolysing)